MEESYTISDIMKIVQKDDIDPIHQLLLAKKLTQAVLQFHSTAWLRDIWNLSDVASFGPNAQLSNDTLTNLHLISDIGQLPMHSRADTPVNEKPSPASAITAEEADIVHGIRNLTIFSLGRALLQIGCWTSLESLKQARWQHLDDPHLIKTARLAARSRMSKELGPRYRDIVLRCLSNNFGFGDDLKNAELQTAVKRQVMLELENIIHDWTHGERNPKYGGV